MRNFIFQVVLLGLLATGCQRQGGLTGRVDTEVKTKYLKTFNDPDSYQLVENHLDSVSYTSYHEALLDSIELTSKSLIQSKKNIKAAISGIAQMRAMAEVYGQYRLFTQTAQTAARGEGEIRELLRQAEAEQATSRQTYTHLVHDTLALAHRHLKTNDTYIIKIKQLYRAKNKAGALQLGAFDFAYYPKPDSLVLVRHMPDYTAPLAATQSQAVK